MSISKKILITCFALVSGVCSVNAHSDVKDLQADANLDQSVLAEQWDATLEAVTDFVSETFDLTGEVPSAEDIWDYLFSQEGESLEAVLGEYREQTSLGNRLEPLLWLSIANGSYWMYYLLQSASSSSPKSYTNHYARASKKIDTALQNVRERGETCQQSSLADPRPDQEAWLKNNPIKDYIEQSKNPA